jgi:hypothetical protein
MHWEFISEINKPVIVSINSLVFKSYPLNKSSSIYTRNPVYKYLSSGYSFEELGPGCLLRINKWSNQWTWHYILFRVCLFVLIILHIHNQISIKTNNIIILLYAHTARRTLEFIIEINNKCHKNSRWLHVQVPK